MEEKCLFLEMLTVLLLVLKFTGTCDVPWWVCIVPAVLPFAFALLSLLIIKKIAEAVEEHDDLF